MYCEHFNLQYGNLVQCVAALLQLTWYEKLDRPGLGNQLVFVILAELS